MPSTISPYYAAGVIDGAADALRNPRERHGYDPARASSWQYKRGFAHQFLALRYAAKMAQKCVGEHRKQMLNYVELTCADGMPRGSAAGTGIRL